MTQPVTDWNLFRKCIRVCRAPIGQPCFTTSSRIINGRPNRVPAFLEFPHNARLLRGRKPTFYAK